MPIRKPAIALTALAGLLASLAVATPADATRIKAACTVAGEVKAQDKHDQMLGVRLVGGKGTFTYSSLGIACVGVKDGIPDAQVLQAQTRGVYESVVCRTAKATGTITSLAGPVKYQNLIVGKKFTIHFLDGAGVFFWHDSDKPGVTDLKDGILSDFTRLTQDGSKPPAPKDWQAAGLIWLDEPTQKTPTAPDPQTNHCTKAFSLFGFLAIDEDDGAGPIGKLR